MGNYLVSIGGDKTASHGHAFLIFTKPDGTEEKFGFYPGEDGHIHWQNEDVFGVEEFWRSETIPISKEQYEEMKQFGGSYSPNFSPIGGIGGENCTTGAVKVLEAGGLEVRFPWKVEFFPWTMPLNGPIIDPGSNNSYLASRTFVPRRDPLALDLDNDGLETTAITGTNPTLFDHDGDGIKTGTGWLKGDDAFLALDRNGNGSIDTGAELFGVDTVLANGQKAANGFAALADLDSNHDGKFSALDTQFANVRVWRDLNQDGISQAGELSTLASAGITSINLTSTATNIALTGGNVQTAAGTYTRTTGATGTVGDFTTGSTGNLNLAQNPFYSEFTNPITLTTAAQGIADMQGAGMVRDLREAASLDGSLASMASSPPGQRPPAWTPQSRTPMATATVSTICPRA